MEKRIQQLWQRGLGHFRNDNLDAAQACFEGILARDPGQSPAFFRLAMVYMQRGANANAVELAEKALALSPGQMEIQVLLARIHLAAGSIARARDYAMLAALGPRESVVTLDSLGAVFSQLGEHRRALEMFDAAIALPTPTAYLFFNRALAQRAAGATAAFEHDLEACLGLEPDHAKSHWYLAQQRRRGRSAGHVEFLRQRLGQLPADQLEHEVLSLALFHELDGLDRPAEAWHVLEKVLTGRRSLPAREPMSWAALRNIVPEPLAPPSGAHGPVFIVGLPRSGVAVLGHMMERHPQLRSLGSTPVFQRRLNAELARLLGKPSHWQVAGDVLEGVDFEALGRDYLEQVAAADDAAICEYVPMNALLLGAIARALPRARFLCMTRDPHDNALSLLALPCVEASLINDDVAKLADHIARHRELMHYWQDNLPGRIMDVQYESLMHKPEMVLRVACAFLGLRYLPSLDAHDLHERRIGHARPYADKLAAIAALA